MVSTSTDRTPVATIGLDVANALWAAMHEDDQLAEHYIDLCIVHGLTHFLEGTWGWRLTQEGQRKLINNLEEARRRLTASEDDFAEIWMDYAEPPF